MQGTTGGQRVSAQAAQSQQRFLESGDDTRPESLPQHTPAPPHKHAARKQRYRPLEPSICSCFCEEPVVLLLANAGMESKKKQAKTASSVRRAVEAGKRDQGVFFALF
jgi:hypothetical protein